MRRVRLPCRVSARRAARGHSTRLMAGFTLIEVIMTLVIFAIVAALGVAMMGDGIQAYFAGRDLVDLDSRGRAAVERMTRELRAVRSATAADLNSTSNAQVRFNDTSGNAVCFYLAGTTLMRSADFAAACGTTNAQALADGVTALNFTYLNNTGVAGAPVYYIEMQFTITQGTASKAYRATVHPRNF